MKAEVVQEVGYMEMLIERLNDYGGLLQGNGDLPLSKLSESVQEQASELVGQVNRTHKDIKDLAERYEWSNGETEEGSAIMNIAIDVVAEVGSLGAVADMATGELPGWGNPNKSAAEVGRDFIRTANYLKKLADRLEKIKVK